MTTTEDQEQRSREGMVPGEIPGRVALASSPMKHPLAATSFCGTRREFTDSPSSSISQQPRRVLRFSYSAGLGGARRGGAGHGGARRGTARRGKART